jgi:hypothetical protein
MKAKVEEIPVFDVDPDWVAEGISPVYNITREQVKELYKKERRGKKLFICGLRMKAKLEEMARAARSNERGDSLRDKEPKDE